jgi:tetratricopeptide (TPR) repeat protein
MRRCAHGAASAERTWGAAGRAIPAAGRPPQLRAVAVAVVVLLAAASRECEAAPSECPAPEDASGMATGERGLEMIKAGDVAGAASCFWRAADRAGSEQEAVGWLKNAAQASEQLEEWLDAVEAWQQMFDTQMSIGQTPELDQMVRVPPLLMKLNQHQQAVNAWGQVVEAHPASAEVKANYAVSLQQLGLFAESVMLYEQALELNPDLEPVYSNLAMALRELGQEERAGEVMRTLEARRAASGAAKQQTYGDLQEIGLDQLNRGDYAAAEASFLRALSLEGGDNYAVHYNLGLVYFFTRQWDKALASYEKSLQVPEKSPKSKKALLKSPANSERVPTHACNTHLHREQAGAAAPPRLLAHEPHPSTLNPQPSTLNAQP